MALQSHYGIPASHASLTLLPRLSWIVYVLSVSSLESSFQVMTNTSPINGQLTSHDLYGEAKSLFFSHKLSLQVHGIYKLAETFWNRGSTPDEIDCAVDGLRLIAPLSGNDVAAKSYGLFHLIVLAPVSPACSEEKKWEASRLVLYGAYKSDEFAPIVDDPQGILNFTPSLRVGHPGREPRQVDLVRFVRAGSCLRSHRRRGSQALRPDRSPFRSRLLLHSPR